MKLDKVRLVAYPHPFKTKRIIKKVDRKTFQELFNEINSPSDISYALIFDGEKKVTDYSELPESDNVYMKIVPSGDNNQEVGGNIAKAAGGLLVGLGLLAGIGIIGTVGFGYLAVGAISTGAGLILGGVALYQLGGLLNQDTTTTTSTSSLQGGNNQTSLNTPVPILLGKHLMYPFNAAPTYTENLIVSGHDNLPTTGDSQYVYELLCFGYDDIVIDESTLKVGTTSFSTLNESQPDSVVYEIRQDNLPATYYPNRKYEVSVGQKVESFGLRIETREITYTVQYEEDREPEGTTVVKREETRTTEVAIYLDAEGATVVTTPTNVIGITINYVATNGIGNFTDGDAVHSVRSGYRIKHESDANFPVKPPPNPVPAELVGGLDTDGYNATYTRVRARTKRTYRWSQYIDTQALFPSDEPEERQYTLKIFRQQEENDTSGINDTFSIFSIVYETADLTVSPIDTNPINTRIKGNLTTLSARLQASELLSGTIDQINAIGTLRTYVYSGTGDTAASWTTLAETQNPASCFLYVLRSQRINKFPTEDSQIDWAAFGDWYNFCETKGFEANFYFSDESTIQNILDEICTVGRASWNMIDGQYTVIVDKPRNDVIQYFTPRNTSNFKGTRAFSDLANCMQMSFTDPDSGYVSSEIYVYSDETVRPGNYPLDDDVIQEVSIGGTVTSDQAYKMGRYLLAVNELRPEVYSFDVDMEYIFCTRGDRVQIAHDAGLIGLTTGRIESVIDDGTNITGFISDEVLRYEENNTYGVVIRTPASGVFRYELINPADTLGETFDGNDITLTTSIPLDTDILADDLFMFGIHEEEVLDVIITSITPSSDISANISCTDYAGGSDDISGVFSADEGTIPEYNPRISLPGDISAGIQFNQVNDLVTVIDDVNDALNTMQSYTNKIQASLTSGSETANLAVATSAMRPVYVSEDSVVFINLEDGNKLYVALFGTLNLGEKLNDVPADWPVYVSQIARLIYSNQNDNSTLYSLDLDNPTTSNAKVTTSSAWGTVADENGFVYYINTDDGNKIYKIEVLNGNGTAISNFAVNGLAYVQNDTLLYINATDGHVYKKNSTDSEAGEEIFNVSVNAISQYSDTEYLYRDGQDGTLYRNFITPTDVANIGTPLFSRVSTFFAENGDIIYTSDDFDNPGYIYYAPSGFVEINPEIPISQINDGFTITGTVAMNGRFVTNVSIEDLELVAVGDVVIGLDIFDLFEDSTLISAIGNNFLIIDKPATNTGLNAQILASGSRLYLNANKTIASGSIDARHLRASAIDSKATDANGNRISAYNLNNGSVVLRKEDGTIVYDFNPNRSGNELLFSGSLTVNATGSDGSSVPTADELIEIGTLVRNQQDGNIAITVSDTAPTNPDTGDLWQNTSVNPVVLNSWNGSAWVAASVAEQTAFELASANDSLLDSTAKIFSPTPDPTNYNIGDLWQRYWPKDQTSNTALHRSNTKSESFDENHWIKTETDELDSARLAEDSVGTVQIQDGVTITDGNFIVQHSTDQRGVQIGDNGILATDTDGDIIHDIATDVTSETFVYAGHYYVLVQTENFTTFTNTTPADTQNHRVALPTISGIDFTQYTYVEVLLRITYGLQGRGFAGLTLTDRQSSGTGTDYRTVFNGSVETANDIASGDAENHFQSTLAKFKIHVENNVPYIRVGINRDSHSSQTGRTNGVVVRFTLTGIYT